MGRLVAIGGGTFDNLVPIHRYAVNLANKDDVKVLFIPTASKDNDGYIKVFGKSFTGFNCTIENLLLTRKEYSDSEINDLINWADIIYVGGGNAVFMMNVWRKYSLDKKLKEVFTTDSAIIVGHGSGALCMFYCGYSNGNYEGGLTDWQMIWTKDLLDLHHAAMCPHYSDNEIKNFDKRLLELAVPGIGLADNTAFVQVEQHTEYVGCTEEDKAVYLIYLNGALFRKEIEMKCLTHNG